MTTKGFSVEELSDRAEILDLMARYCHGLDRRDTDAFLSIWHEDAVWEMGDLGAFAGLNAIKVCLELIWAVFPETHHYTLNPAIELQGDRAAAWANAMATTYDQSGTGHESLASYDDVFERRDGHLRIARRRVILHKGPDLAAVGLVT